jgi:hypothetical protein
LKICLVFFIAVLSGASLHELIRLKVAQNLKFDCAEFKNGHLHFSNSSLNSKSISRTHDEWNFWIRGQALIELSAKVYLYLVSFLGLQVLYLRRHPTINQFNLLDWFYIACSMFVLKQVFLSALFIIRKSKFCEYGMFTKYFNLPFWGTKWFLLIIGLLMVAKVLIKFVPKGKIIEFLFSSAFGSASAILLWYFFIGKVLFN